MIRFIIFSFLLIAFKTEGQTSVLKRADSLYATGNYSKAIEHYNTYDNPSEVYENIAKSYIALGNYDMALANYSKALEAHPDDVVLKFNSAKLMGSMKKYQEASLLFYELVSKDNTNPNYQYELGVTLEALNDSTAIEHFRTAFELDSTHQKAIYKIARKYLVDRKHDESLKYINIGLESYANNVELISLKAQNYYWKEDYREAAKWFEKLIELGESSEFVHEKLCMCYAKHFEYKKAAEHCELTLAYDPKNWSYLFILGEMYTGLEDFGKASQNMSLALNIRDIPLDNEYRKLGYALNRNGNYKEALEALNKSLNINPEDETTKFYILMAKDKQLDTVEKRLKLYEDFKTKNPESGYNDWIDYLIKQLKEEKFMKAVD